MKKQGLVVLVLLLAAGCALPARPPGATWQEPAVMTSSLWRLKISQWEEQNFAGLLGTKFANDGLHYVLLDGTGVTLLEARLDATGERQTLRELGILEGHRLPAFLGTSLYRIFLLEPATRPCGRNFLMRLCRRKTDGGERKYAQAGLLPLWSVDYVTVDQELPTVRITFTNPWLGVTLQLVAD